jgi:hypothetical protein
VINVVDLMKLQPAHGLSEGDYQPCELASARLNTMNVRFKSQMPGSGLSPFPTPSSNRLWNSGKAKTPT